MIHLQKKQNQNFEFVLTSSKEGAPGTRHVRGMLSNLRHGEFKIYFSPQEAVSVDGDTASYFRHQSLKKVMIVQKSFK